MAEVFTEETFWVGASHTPQCALERLALDVFNFHTAAAAAAHSFDASRSGAEWCAAAAAPFAV